MEKINFTDIHELLLQVLGIKKDEKLRVIGEWYYRFLHSEKDELNLILPAFDLDFTGIAYKYVRFLTLIHILSLKKTLLNFDKMCLFDVFNYSSNKGACSNYLLDYKSSKNQIASWSNGTISQLNKFLPVFNKDQIDSKEHLEAILNSFPVFKLIRKQSLINSPVLIDLDEDITLVFNCLDFQDKLITELEISSGEKMDDCRAADKEDELLNTNINYRVNLKYPYSKEPHYYLLDKIGKKRFNLTCNARFYNADFSDTDVALLPNEYVNANLSSIVASLDYQIVNTNHDLVLYDLLKGFKQKWQNLELNIFVAPFPKYWFLFVNKGISREEWLIQFKKDYPSVANKPIIKDVESIISELYDLNWIENVVEKLEDIKILYTELKGLRKKRLNKVFNLFKDYVLSLGSEIEFVELTTSSLSEHGVDYIFLNAFDVIDLVNIGGSNLNEKLKIVVPDFIYYGYQPWVKYHIFDYQARALCNESREDLDVNFELNHSIVNSLKRKIIQSIKHDIRAYNNRYNIEVIEIPIEEIDIDKGEDLELSNSEEISGNNSTSIKKEQLLIRTVAEEELRLVSNETVLLQKDSVVRKLAGTLKPGDLFMLSQDLNELIKDEYLLKKLSKLPDVVKNYQSKLNSYDNIYNILKSKGISYATQNYFKTNYLIAEENLNEENFKLPRRKSDWLIICDFLSIDHNEMNLAFIVYYGRKRKSRIKDLYKEVINLFVVKDYFGISESPLVLKDIETIVERFQDILMQEEEYSLSEVSDSIASTLMNELRFREVKEIKIFENELF